MDKKQLLILLLFSLVAGFIVASLLWGGDVFAPSSENEPLRTEPRETGPVAVSLELDSENYSYGERMRVRTEIENITVEVQEFSFSSGCTEATYMINELPTQQSRICTMAIVDIELEPGEVITHEYDIEVVEELPSGAPDLVEYEGQAVLTEGGNTIYAQWHDYRSHELTFTVN